MAVYLTEKKAAIQIVAAAMAKQHFDYGPAKEEGTGQADNGDESRR